MRGVGVDCRMFVAGQAPGALFVIFVYRPHEAHKGSSPINIGYALHLLHMETVPPARGAQLLVPR